MFAGGTGRDIIILGLGQAVSRLAVSLSRSGTGRFAQAQVLVVWYGAVHSAQCTPAMWMGMGTGTVVDRGRGERI